jgi:L-ascorbate metabolism protein UlaG (beta-lactamase superfamily)
VSGVRITHIGGPTCLLEFEGWTILTDPTFDPPGETYKFGWGTSSKKVAGPTVAIADLPPIDAVLVSHDHHGDNLDVAGRALLEKVGTVVTTIPGAKRLGRDVRGLAPWATTRLVAPDRPTITVTATPCRHGPPLSRPIAGAVIGFALAWEGQDNGVLWISGDTVLYDGVRHVADRLDVDVAILHLGAVQFGLTGPLRYSMTGTEAVELCRLVQPRTAIPVHYEGWSHFSEGLDGITRDLDAAPDEIRAKFRILPMGEAVDIPA